MKKALFAILSFGLLAALPSYALSGLKLTCTTEGLSPGARVWLEVEPQFQATTAGDPAQGGFKDAGAPEPADGKYVWQFQVPASGERASLTHRFGFPTHVALKSGAPSGSVLLKTRFRIDDPARPHHNGYGEIIEQTFAMPAPTGVTELSRCLLLRQEGDHLTVGTAADCRDSTFAKAAKSGVRIRGKMGSQ
jgi:hypothetical protein